VVCVISALIDGRDAGEILHPFILPKKGDSMSLSHRTKVSLQPLTILKERKHFIVEDSFTGEFYEMPEVCIEAINMINEGSELESIECVLKRKYPHEEVDILDFVKQLLELGLVHKLDGEEIPRKTKAADRSGYTWIPSSVGRFFFNDFSVKLYVILFVMNVILLVLNQGLLPRYIDFFVFDLMLQNIFVWLLITFVLVLVHEWGHILAARSEGLPAKLGLGHRLFFVVLETDMSHVWKIPAEKRNMLYLAGMYFDSVVLFVALTGQLFVGEGTMVAGLLKLVVLDTFIRLIYQAAVFMKTDLYYVLENMTGSYNLMENGQDFLSRWIPFLKRNDTESFKGEERLVRGYAVFYLLGIALTMGIAAVYYIPQLMYAMNLIMLPGFSHPISSIRFWDSAVFLLQIILVLGLLLYSWSKKYRYSS
jgi:putative peptide zinc metalloprotease protein